MAMTEQQARNAVISAVQRVNVTRTRAASRHALRASVSLDDLQTLVAAAVALVTLGDVKEA